MSRHRTGTSSSYGDKTNPSIVGAGPDAPSKAGLVLLYARNFDQFLPAYPFLQPTVVIGREPPADVCVPEQAVSRQHARIAFDGTRWILSDLGSRNGTYLDGRRIDPSTPYRITRGSKIGFGKPEQEWEMVDDSAPSAMATPLDGGATVLLDGELIALPSSSDPRATIYRKVHQYGIITPAS